MTAFDDVRCAACLAMTRCARDLRVVSYPDEFPDGAIAQSGFGDTIEGFLPLCADCLLICPTCGELVLGPAAVELVDRLTRQNADAIESGDFSVHWFFGDACDDGTHERPARRAERTPKPSQPSGPSRPPRPERIPGWQWVADEWRDYRVGDAVRLRNGGRVGNILYIWSRRPIGVIFTVEYPDQTWERHHVSQVVLADRSGEPTVLPTLAIDDERPSEEPSVVHVVTDDPDVRAQLAQDAYDRRMEDDFGTGTVSTLFTDAITDAVWAAIEAAGQPLDTEELESVLFLPWSVTLSESDLEELHEAETRDDVEYVVSSLIEDVDPDELLSELGETEEIGGWDSSDFAVMTAGSMTMNVLRRGDEYTQFETGDDSDAAYAFDGRYRVADDPDLRFARLRLAEDLGGLGPGVWIGRADDLDDELRTLTMESGNWRDWWFGEFPKERDNEVRAAQIDERLRRFAAASGLDDSRARSALADLIADPIPRTPQEAAGLWALYSVPGQALDSKPDEPVRTGSGS